jgi:pimeloyl-ACP methyl ester carboxylesterase
VRQGAESVVVFAGSAGGPIAARYAAEHPLQVQRLVLYGSYLNGAAIADPAAREMLLNLIRRHWGLGSRVLADVLIPGATAAERDEFVSLQRDSAPAELAARSLETTYTFSGETPQQRSDHPPRFCTEPILVGVTLLALALRMVGLRVAP